ncbi:MAG: AI-2E family transporter [Gemmatimonadota bacterium]
MSDEADRDPPHEQAERPRPDIRQLGDLFRGPVDIRSIALTGIFVLALLYTFYFARGFLLPIVLALLLNFLLRPLVRALRRIYIPEAIGAALVILALLSAVAFGVYQLSGPAAAWLDRAPEGMVRIERRIRELRRPVENVREAAEQVGEQVEQLAGGDDGTQQVEVQGASFGATLLSRTQSFIGGLAVMLILLYFMLASGDLFLRKLIRVLPSLSDKKRAVEIARQTEDHISTYLLTVTAINLGLGLAVGLGMKLVGMPNPVLWGVVAGLLNFIPYLGALMTVGVLTLVSLLTFDDIGRALLAPLVYFGINFIEGSVVTPTLLARRLTLNPVVVFVGLMFWGWMWGVPGALLAVPILATFKIFCDHIPPLSPIGEFLGR